MPENQDKKPVQETKKELKWLAFIWSLLFSLGSLGSCILVAFQGGVKWIHLDNQERFLIVVAITVNWGNAMGAFVSKTFARIKEGRPLTNGVGVGHDSAPPFKT